MNNTTKLKTIFDALEFYHPKHFKVLALRWGIYNGEILTLEEIGKEFGLTRGRIRQIEDEGLKILGRAMIKTLLVETEPISKDEATSSDKEE